MAKEAKIKLKNLYWAYSEDMGVVPYIFNNDTTAIKVFSEHFGYKVLDLTSESIMDTKITQKAIATLDKEYGEGFAMWSTFDVFDKTFTLAEKIIRTNMAGGCDNIRFSAKDIERMRTKYNKHMARKRAEEEKRYQKENRDEIEQENIMNF